MTCSTYSSDHWFCPTPAPRHSSSGGHVRRERAHSSGSTIDGRWIDLLKSDDSRRYITNPEYLRQEIDAEGLDRNRQVVIDEIQKVPDLLD